MAAVSRHEASDEDDEEESPPSKRQKVAAACDQCRAKKIKCDGNKPGQWGRLCLRGHRNRATLLGALLLIHFVTQSAHLASCVTGHFHFVNGLYAEAEAQRRSTRTSSFN